MNKEVKWTKYLWLSLLSFGAFFLEYLSIFLIEVIFLHVDIQNYTAHQRNIQCIIMAFIWAFFISVLLYFSRKYYHFSNLYETYQNFFSHLPLHLVRL